MSKQRRFQFYAVTRKFLFTYLLFSFCTALMFCNSVSAATPDAASGKTYRLFASGDTMLGRRFPALVYEKGPVWPLQQLSDLIKHADIAMTNLECVIATRGTFWDKGEEAPYHFRAPPRMLDVLTEAGFDVVMTSNNHSMDFGPEALLEELELLDAVNIMAVGSGRNAEAAAKPKYIKVGDRVMAIIGLTTYNSHIAAQKDRAGALWANDDKQILDILGPAITEARHHADLVIFSPHWGGNWTEHPTPQRVELAHKLIDLGVDAILGHSAHQLHGIEIYKNKPIVYDWEIFSGIRNNSSIAAAYPPALCWILITPALPG